MTEKVIFRELNPYHSSGLMVGGHLSESDIWEYRCREKYRIKKYLSEYSSLSDSYYVGLDPAFEQAIKKVPLSEAMLKAREPETRTLKEIPLGITEDDELICLPEENELPRIFVFGKTGMGKSIFAHRLLDYMYNMFNYKICGLNDWRIETKYWGRPNYYSELKILGEHPGIGLPIIMLMPTIKNRIDPKMGTPTVYISLNWNQFIDRIDTFAELGGSEKYMQTIKSNLKDVKSYEEFIERLDDCLPDKNDRPMKNKIIATFGKYMQLGILNPTNTGDERKLTTVGYDLLTVLQNDEIILDGEIPMIALARLGVVPMLVTSDLKIYDDAYNRIMKFYIDWIIDKKNVDDNFRRDNLILYIDELSIFCSVKKKSASISSVKTMIQRGRLLKIGAVLVTQNISEIQSEIVSNCNYFAVFSMPSFRDVKILSDNLNLDKEHRDAIKKLDKFECLIISREKPLTIYDLEENKIRHETGIFKVRTFLSLGEHEGVLADQDTAVSRRFDYDMTGGYLGYPLKILSDNNIMLCARKESKALGPFRDVLYYRKEADLYLKKTAIQKKDFKLPRIIEGISIAKYFYKKDMGLISKTYDELKEKGFYIVTLSDGYYTIMKREKIKSPPMVVHQSQPKDIKFILYNERFKTAKLIGNGVSNKPVTLEPMIKR